MIRLMTWAAILLALSVPVKAGSSEDYPRAFSLIVCKVILGPADDNTQFTGWRPSEFDTEGGVMHCRRIEIEVYDPSVDQGAAEQPFNEEACRRTAMRLGPQYDADQINKEKQLPAGARGTRFWRAACPVPVWSDNGTPDNPRDDYIVGYTPPPPCPESNGTVICEVDSAI